MERRIFSWILLSVLLSVTCVGALNVEIPQPVYEFARGDDVELACKFTPAKPLKETDLAIISWVVESTDADAEDLLFLTHYTNPLRTDIKEMYEGRVSIDVDILSGKANLRLSSITLADNRNFQCRVQIPGDDEGNLVDSTRLVVLVAPSTPTCKTEGKAEYGQNINLTCKSEEGSPPPTYEWKNLDVRSMPRPHAPRTTDKNGILSLYNITKDTSGIYICTSQNKIRSATCNITLAVMPPSMNIGSTAGIIAAVVGGLIALIVIIYCCCCRKKDKEEEYAMGEREEEEYHDKEPAANGERREREERGTASVDRRDRYEERSERGYDDRRSDYDDRRSDYDDRRSDYDDRRSDYNDRRSDYVDRRSDYNDRRSDYDDRRDRYGDRNERYDDSRHYDDDRRYNDRRDRRDDDNDRYNDRSRPTTPNNKPPRRDDDN